MSKAHGTMLELWRPPRDAGDPIGCMATTYTFAPCLFDEQCLAMFLEIESEPERESLAFCIEKESRLGSVYAGVLVDQTQAGVEHSLRWDVLPVRVPRGKQHAKVSLLVWSRHARIIVASANLSEPGYRSNYEVASAVDLTPVRADSGMLNDTIAFLRHMLALVPGSSANQPEVIGRAHAFLEQVQHRTSAWASGSKRGVTLRQQLVCTMPAVGDQAARSALEEAVAACRMRGASPFEVWIASPFFDHDARATEIMATLCKSMARGARRMLRFDVPAAESDGGSAVPRLAAPKALIEVPPSYQGETYVGALPTMDGDGNYRPWHAKMLALFDNAYTALMVGSSNFTCAGMGVGSHRNIEANLLTIVDNVSYGREARNLRAIWPEATPVDDLENAEWFDIKDEAEEEEQTGNAHLPAGFLCATYRAGDERTITMRLDPARLPAQWCVCACGQAAKELVSAQTWNARGCPAAIEIPWEPPYPPEKLLVRWTADAEHEAFMPLNVEDSRRLPVPAQLGQMTADDRLLILAATDPSAALRLWARKHQPDDTLQDDLDTATPADLDPLRRYDLQTTFLHRIRRRARVLAQLRANLQRPAWSRRAVEWRLRGILGIAPLADCLVRELDGSQGPADEALLNLADFLIVLREVEYEAEEGALSRQEFGNIFKPFLRELAGQLDARVAAMGATTTADVSSFWKRVVQQCLA